MSTESHLASLGVTMQQARVFISSHANDPFTIFDVAYEYDITTSMLSEITGYSTSDISAYFTTYGLDSADLDGVSLPSSNLASLTNYMALNDSTGILSTAALRESIIAATSSDDYFAALNPSKFIGAEDGVFTSNELGTARLGNVAATTENIESLLFGTFIHVFKAIDVSETMQFGQITEFLADPTNNANSPNFLVLMNSVFSDPAPNPIFSDTELVEAVTGTAVPLVEKIGSANGAIQFDSILNLSA